MSQVDESVQPKRARQVAFLRAFASCGIVTRACGQIGISRQVHYDWLSEDSDYRDEFARAIEQAGPAVEEEIFRRGMQGVLKPVFHKGKVCGTVREFSDTLLIFAAKRVMPDKYRERFEHTGPNGAPLVQDRIREVILVALERYPEARQQVAQKLLELEAAQEETKP